MVRSEGVCTSSQGNEFPEPDRRGKPWIGRVWLTNVFRGGMRGVRAGYARRGPRVFRAHRNLEGLTERPKIFPFQVWLRIVFRRGMRGFKELGFKLYRFIVIDKY